MQNNPTLTPEKAEAILRTGAELLGNHDYLSAEYQLNLVADWIQKQAAETPPVDPVDWEEREDYYLREHGMSYKMYMAQQQAVRHE